MLKGPADADAYRVEVGRYKDRWYHDPLPGDEVASATDDFWPSVSTVKGAWPKFLTAWAAGEAAKYAVDNLDALGQLDRDAAIALISKAHDRSRDGAAARGTAVHALLEAFSLGQEPDALTIVEAGDWADAARQLVAELQPTWLLSEVVVINRTLGVGGTADAVWQVGDSTYLVDFKSRKLGKHGVYLDEGAQLGAYASADYAIVERDGRAVRVELPPIDAGLIISIDPAGYRCFPIAVAEAVEDFKAVRLLWQRMRDSSALGKPIVLRQPPLAGDREPRQPKPDTEPPQQAAADLQMEGVVTRLRSRVATIIEAGHGAQLAAMWPEALPTLKAGPHTGDQLQTIARLCSRVEAANDMPFVENHAAEDERYLLLAEFDASEQAALISDAFNGATPTVWTATENRRLRDLVAAIDAVKVAFTYEGETAQLVKVSAA